MGRGKKSNRAYVTASEWANEFGGAKAKRLATASYILPYDCCALSLQPFRDPVGTRQGFVFDLLNVYPYIRKFKTNPVNGEPLSTKDLIKLHFHKNKDGEYQCPVMYKNFTKHTKICFIATTGNVYSYEAVRKMNFERKSLLDLLDSTPFKREDVIVIFDPEENSWREIGNFHHIRENIKVSDAKPEVQQSSLLTAVMSDLKKEEDREKREGKTRQPVATTSSTREGEFSSAGLTCAGFSARVDDVEPKKTSKKGYVSIVTNKGALNLELHCDLAPLTCENFLTHCENGYYDGTIFHRLIPGFMIQGGDPTGTGRGGTSIWKSKFQDEFSPMLAHTRRGVLSMANSGRNTNGSQFFITFGPAGRLNNLHSIFGQLVGGAETLDVLEKIPTFNDKPNEEIKILRVIVYTNPFTPENMAAEAAEIEAERQKKEQEERESKEMGLWYTQSALGAVDESSGVGKYLKLPSVREQKKRTESSASSSSSVSKPLALKLGVVKSDTKAHKRRMQRKKTPSFGSFDNF